MNLFLCLGERDTARGKLRHQRSDILVLRPVFRLGRQFRPVPDLAKGQFRHLALDARPIGIVRRGGRGCFGCEEKEYTRKEETWLWPDADAAPHPFHLAVKNGEREIGGAATSSSS